MIRLLQSGADNFHSCRADGNGHAETASHQTASASNSPEQKISGRWAPYVHRRRRTIFGKG